MHNSITISGNFILINSDEWFELRKENERLKEELRKLEEEIEILNFR